MWSAACSTGQEAYSLAMLLRETLEDADNWDLQIVATDIADNAFRRAAQGLYSKLEVGRGLDEERLQRYFSLRSDNYWQVSEKLRSMVDFRKINLVVDDFRSLGWFDMVLCRNVAIYFDYNTKVRLLTKIAGTLDPKGYLFVGATESASQILPLFKPNRTRSVIYYTLALPEAADS